MISLSHWGLLDIEAWRTQFSFDGPAYADRVNGKLTFHDWDEWTKEDREAWYAERIRRFPLGRWITREELLSESQS